MDMVPPNATKFYKDKFVVIASDKPIDSSHLDIVLMFLESASLSGGGNILNHEINARMNILTLEYEHRLFKHRVLQKKSLDFHGYKFTASEPGIELDEPEVIDDRLLILKNVSEDLDDFVVKLYVQNLAIEDDLCTDRSTSDTSSTCVLRKRSTLSIACSVCSDGLHSTSVLLKSNRAIQLTQSFSKRMN